MSTDISHNLKDCDAFTMWSGIMKGEKTLQERQAGLKVWVKAWKGIEPYSKFIHYEFVETTTGEVHEMNCRIDMDSVMIDNKFYPAEILNQITAYEN